MLRARRVAPLNTEFMPRAALRLPAAVEAVRELAPRATWLRRIVDAALELARDACKMPVHGGTRAVRIARGDRGDDGRVVADRSHGEIGRMEVLLHAVPTTRRAGPTALRRRARASCCRSPWRGAGGSRGPRIRAPRNRRRSPRGARRSCASASASSAVATVAASAAISPSTSLRAASNSNGPGPASRLARLRPPAAMSRRCRCRRAPRPSPLISSEMIASRTDVRLTPSETASSRSAGRREPDGNSPFAISCAS